MKKEPEKKTGLNSMSKDDMENVWEAMFSFKKKG